MLRCQSKLQLLCYRSSVFISRQVILNTFFHFHGRTLILASATQPAKPGEKAWGPNSLEVDAAALPARVASSCIWWRACLSHLAAASPQISFALASAPVNHMVWFLPWPRLDLWLLLRWFNHSSAAVMLAATPGTGMHRLQGCRWLPSSLFILTWDAHHTSSVSVCKPPPLWLQIGWGKHRNLSSFFFLSHWLVLTLGGGGRKNEWMDGNDLRVVCQNYNSSFLPAECYSRLSLVALVFPLPLETIAFDYWLLIPIEWRTKARDYLSISREGIR